MVSEVVYCATEFELEALYSRLVGGVAEVARGVEGFFDAEGVVLHEMPAFGFFGETSPCTYGNDFTAVVELKRKPTINIRRERFGEYLTKKA